MSLYPVDTRDTGCQVTVLTVIHSEIPINFHAARIFFSSFVIIPTYPL